MTGPDWLQAEKSLLQAMKDYPLKPGQMLLLGPLSVAYLKGDVLTAPWLYAGYRAPGGKLLPDKHVLEESEWRPH